MKHKHMKRIYKLLQELDSELQYLGVRGDWGFSEEPTFFAETLECCLGVISHQDNAPKDLLIQISRNLLDYAVSCERRQEFGDNGPYIVSGKDMWDAGEKNDVIFARLLLDYKKEFVIPQNLCQSHNKQTTS